jgi:hypothetical protein
MKHLQRRVTRQQVFDERGRRRREVGHALLQSDLEDLLPQRRGVEGVGDQVAIWQQLFGKRHRVLRTIGDEGEFRCCTQRLGESV